MRNGPGAAERVAALAGPPAALLPALAAPLEGGRLRRSSRRRSPPARPSPLRRSRGAARPAPGGRGCAGPTRPCSARSRPAGCTAAGPRGRTASSTSAGVWWPARLSQTSSTAQRAAGRLGSASARSSPSCQPPRRAGRAGRRGRAAAAGSAARIAVSSPCSHGCSTALGARVDRLGAHLAGGRAEQRQQLGRAPADVLVGLARRVPRRAARRGPAAGWPGRGRPRPASTPAAPAAPRRGRPARSAPFWGRRRGRSPSPPSRPCACAGRSRCGTRCGSAARCTRPSHRVARIVQVLTAGSPSGRAAQRPLQRRQRPGGGAVLLPVRAPGGTRAGSAPAPPRRTATGGPPAVPRRPAPPAPPY